jgi:hypothetical protein
MYQHVSWWFSPPHGENDKWKNKNACQAIMLDGLIANQAKGMRKAH